MFMACKVAIKISDNYTKNNEVGNIKFQRTEATGKNFHRVHKRTKLESIPKTICKIMIKSSHFDKNKTIPPPI